ncbi:GNAT family N-acetyltransferase [Herpetosiphon gulosus]|uniref:N-acetyltransferase domain-containing protein n=1 Tax=Herpetosiphon gulosus TaxID=1973496 RepID=A0ABP9WYF0_9CHLR
MHFIQRAFRPDHDQQAMLALASANPDQHLRSIDLPYRLSSWALDDPANLAIWQTETGQIVGWAALQVPFWMIDLVWHPAALPSLYRAMLEWADQRAQSLIGTHQARPAWFVSVFEQQHRLRQLLAAQGFADQSAVEQDPWSKYVFRRGNQAPSPTTLPAGISIRPLAGMAEIAAYTNLHRAVFESTSMTESWRANTLKQPSYRAELDLVAVDQIGALVGFCIGWFNQQGFGGRPSGQIEPLGVRADLRQQGIAQALLAENFRRLLALGAEQIFVETDNYRGAAFNLYETVGFAIHAHGLVYRKNYSA